MKIDLNQETISNEVIEICRVAKVTRGGKRLRFRVLAVVGDGQGHVGLGIGKSVEIPQAIQQAIRDGIKNMIDVPIVSGTIPHEVTGKYKAARVILRPAYPGTGIIAGHTVRAICRLAGIRDILTKALGSTNALNLARATLTSLSELETAEQVAKRRDKTVEEMVGAKDD